MVQASPPSALVEIGAGGGGGGGATAGGGACGGEVLKTQSKLVVGGRVVQPQGFCVFMIA